MQYTSGQFGTAIRSATQTFGETLASSHVQERVPLASELLGSLVPFLVPSQSEDKA